MHIAYVTDHLAALPNGLAQATTRTLAHLRAVGHTVQWLQAARSQGQAASVEQAHVAPVAAAVSRAWQAQPPQLVHAATAGPLARAALRAARAQGIATTADWRSHHGTRLAGRTWAARWELLGLRRLHALSDASFAMPASRIPQLAELGIAASACAGRGVDTRVFAPAWRDPWLRQEWHAGSGAPVLLLLGALHSDKNPGLALRAFDRLQHEQPGLRMVVVGDGPLRAALQRDHPRVRFAGVQLGTELARHIASADLLLYPSLADSGGTAVLEAMACGLGIVAFASGAAAAYARDGVSACLATLDADASAERAFTQALRRALPQARVGGDMRRAARAAAERHGWDGALQRFEAAVLPATERLPAAHGGMHAELTPLLA